MFFILDDIWTPLTVLATRETLYLLRESHQWRKGSSTAGESSEESQTGTVTVEETLPISCVSSIILWLSEPCRMDLKLYDEVRFPSVCFFRLII